MKEFKELSANVRLKYHPKSGKQAYKLLLSALNAEIEEKQSILTELKDENVKQKFIKEWKPETKSVTIYGT